jgi:anti-anti-sigma factor
MARFDIQREELEEGSYAVSVAGRIDLHAAPALKRELLDIAAGGGRTIVADLAGATLFDSTPLGVLLAVSRRLEATGATLSVVCSDALLAFVVRTGLDQVLDVVGASQAPDARHAALASA